MVCIGLCPPRARFLSPTHKSAHTGRERMPGTCRNCSLDSRSSPREMHNQAHDRPDSLAAGLVIDLTAPYSEVRAYGRDGGLWPGTTTSSKSFPATLLWRLSHGTLRGLRASVNLDAQKKTYRSGKREDVEGC